MCVVRVGFVVIHPIKAQHLTCKAAWGKNCLSRSAKLKHLMQMNPSLFSPSCLPWIFPASSVCVVHALCLLPWDFITCCFHTTTMVCHYSDILWTCHPRCIEPFGGKRDRAGLFCSYRPRAKATCQRSYMLQESRAATWQDTMLGSSSERLVLRLLDSGFCFSICQWNWHPIQGPAGWWTATTGSMRRPMAKELASWMLLGLEWWVPGVWFVCWDGRGKPELVITMLQ